MAQVWTKHDAGYIRPLYAGDVVFNPDGWVFSEPTSDKVAMEGGTSTFAKLKAAGLLERRSIEQPAGVGQHAKQARRRFYYVLNVDGRAFVRDFLGLDD